MPVARAAADGGGGGRRQLGVVQTPQFSACRVLNTWRYLLGGEKG